MVCHGPLAHSWVEPTSHAVESWRQLPVVPNIAEMVVKMKTEEQVAAHLLELSFQIRAMAMDIREDGMIVVGDKDSISDTFSAWQSVMTLLWRGMMDLKDGKETKWIDDIKWDGSM